MWHWRRTIVTIWSTEMEVIKFLTHFNCGLDCTFFKVNMIDQYKFYWRHFGWNTPWGIWMCVHWYNSTRETHWEIWMYVHWYYQRDTVRECEYIDAILTRRHGEGSEYAYTGTVHVCTRGTIQQERHGEGYELFLEKITKCDWTISLTTNQFSVGSYSWKPKTKIITNERNKIGNILHKNAFV